MIALASICRRFAASTRGIAAVEFAMIVPVLLLLFLASFDAGSAIAVYMKVRSATLTLATITNQYTTSSNAILAADMTAITGSTAAVLAPYSNTPLFGYFVTSAITLSDNLYVTPRSSVCIQYISTPSTC
jgi:Flp pilus assembly protein TadG